MSDADPSAPPVPPASPPPALPAPLAPPPPVRRILPLAAGFYGIVAVFAFGYAAFSKGLHGLFGERAPAPANYLAAVLVALGVVGACHLGDRLFAPVRRAREAMTEILGRLGYGEAVLLALLSGFAEELLFRGALWPHLGFWGTSLLFGLVHVVPKKALLAYPLFAVAGGLLLGRLREGSGSVLPPMLAHVIVNAANLVWIERRRRTAATPSAPR